MDRGGKYVPVSCAGLDTVRAGQGGAFPSPCCHGVPGTDLPRTDLLKGLHSVPSFQNATLFSEDSIWRAPSLWVNLC